MLASVDAEKMANEPQLQPHSKAARLSLNATPAGAPPALGLALGLGVGTAGGRSAFTFLQLQELEHQALIYKYIVAGVPVPLHLVLPIWKSVADAAATASPSSAYAQCPSFLVGFGGLCFDYRNTMEAEPGRCRRTDGKKWRCARDVVPDHKYCERHMHRGRNRSRKHVERGPSAALVAAAPPQSAASVSPPRLGLSPSPTCVLLHNGTTCKSRPC